VQALAALLDTDSPDLRAAAAVTLGDFEQLSPEVVARLISIARSDASSDAREAAGAATARYEGRSPETAMTIAPLGE
jgi:HEAT repeat protein